MADFIVNTSGKNVDEFTTCMNNFIPKIIVSGPTAGSTVTFTDGETTGTAEVSSLTNVAEYVVNSYGNWTISCSGFQSDIVNVNKLKYYTVELTGA